MCTPSPTASASASDISSFAAWELLHPDSLTPDLRDMASPSRVWRGEDSSNDARGGSGSGSEDDNLDLPPTLKSKAKSLSSVGGVLGKGKKGRTEIPSSTADESSQSQVKKIGELERVEVCYVFLRKVAIG